MEYRAQRYGLTTGTRYLMFLETYPDGVPASLLNQSQAVFRVAPDGSYLGGTGNDLPMNRTTLTAL
nr:hypothetical protein [Micromonospora sp. DSM 115978]